MNAEQEKAINLPGVVSALIALLAAVQCVLEYGPDWASGGLYATLAFVPARLTFLFSPDAVIERLEALELGARGAQQQALLLLDARWSALPSLLGYAFLHADWTHFFVNALTLSAFGAPVARRLGPTLFLAFLGACAVAGALTHFALHPFDFTPVVGASAAISGAMAAIARFAFAPEPWRGGVAELGATPEPAAPLSGLRENRQAALFLVLWLGVNVLLGVFPQAIGSAGPIAWEAHMGGFLFGLITFGVFERAAHWRRK